MKGKPRSMAAAGGCPRVCGLACEQSVLLGPVQWQIEFAQSGDPAVHARARKDHPCRASLPRFFRLIIGGRSVSSSGESATNRGHRGQRRTVLHGPERHRRAPVVHYDFLNLCQSQIAARIMSDPTKAATTSRNEIEI